LDSPKSGRPLLICPSGFAAMAITAITAMARLAEILLRETGWALKRLWSKRLDRLLRAGCRRSRYLAPMTAHLFKADQQQCHIKVTSE